MLRAVFVTSTRLDGLQKIFLWSARYFNVLPVVTLFIWLRFSLQRLGVEVHAADRYDHAPAMQVAHYAYTLNMADATELKQLIEKVQPNLIVPEIEAIATSVLLEVEAQNIATVIPSAKAVNLTMNREGIRRLAAEELGLPTSAYRFANSLESFRAACDDIGYPNFVKPVMSSSGKGQSRVTCFDEVDAAWEYAQTGGLLHVHESHVRVGNIQIVL